MVDHLYKITLDHYYISLRVGAPNCKTFKNNELSTGWGRLQLFSHFLFEAQPESHAAGRPGDAQWIFQSALVKKDVSNESMRRQAADGGAGRRDAEQQLRSGGCMC